MLRPIRAWWPFLAALMLALPTSAGGGDKPARADVSVVVAFPGQADAADTAQTAGSSLFKTYCATCHGVEARGDGPLAGQLRVRPPDLTLFTRRNGSFDREKVRRIVDGRQPVKGHGGADMPVWGDVFKRAEEGYSEKKPLERIQQLVDYLAAIQRE
jgi:mono/diheme cytochrome c family protein